MDDPCSWTTTVHDHCLTTPLGRPLLDDHCSRPLFDDHCSWTTPVHGRPLFDDPYWTTTVHDHCLTTTVHGRPLFDDPSWTTPIGRPLFDDHCSWTTTVHDHCLTTPLGRPLTHWTIQSKKTITWSTEVRIKKFESLTSSSLMGLQFIRRIYFQIHFISDPKTRFKVRLVDPNWQN